MKWKWRMVGSTMHIQGPKGQPMENWFDDLFPKAYAKLEAEAYKKIGPDRLAHAARLLAVGTENERRRAEITTHHARAWLKKQKF